MPIGIEPGVVRLQSLDTDEVESVGVDDVLLQIGYEADGTLFEAVGCRLEGADRAVSHDPDTMETSVPGLYVAGTAVAGTQGRFTVYIENSHVHATRIAAALAGEPVPPTPELPVLPES